MNFWAISRSESSQPLLGQRLQLGEIGGLLDAARKRAVGDLQHQREAERLRRDLEVGGAGDHHRRRHRHLVVGHQLVEIDLVGAADHRQRVVDDRHAFLLGAAREAVGVVGDRRGLADEQRIVVGEPGEILLGDRLDLDAHLFGDLRPVAQRLDLRRRQLLMRVDQRGEAVAGRRARLGVAPFAVGEGVERDQEPRLLVGAHARQRQQRDLADRRPLRAFADGDLQRRRAEPVEQELGEAVPGLRRADAEEDRDARRKGAAEILAALVERHLQFRQRMLVELRLRQVDHRLDGRNDPVAARAGQQRGIVAAALVAVIVGKVDHLRPLPAKQRRVRQIVAVGDDLVRCRDLIEIALPSRQYDPGHVIDSRQNATRCTVRSGKVGRAA